MTIKRLHQYYIDKEFKPFNPQCILFDIDGVLIDIRKSYNIVIKKTVDFILNYIIGDTVLKGIVNDDIILKFRQTGGFNNDTDTSYAIAVGIVVNAEKSIGLTRGVGGGGGGGVGGGGGGGGERVVWGGCHYG